MASVNILPVPSQQDVTSQSVEGATATRLVAPSDGSSSGRQSTSHTPKQAISPPMTRATSRTTVVTDPRDLDARPPKRRGRFARYIIAELHKDDTRIPLAINCFLSGFIGCITFSAASIWVGFQTGNTVQTAMAVSRAIYDPNHNLNAFSISDRQAVCSLTCFIGACQIGGRLHFRLSRTSRIWIMLSVFVQMLLTLGAAVAAFHADGPTFNLSRATPSFHTTYGYLAIGLLSASMGLQGVVGESLGSGFTATVVLTSVYCQLATCKWPWKWSPPRDDRVLSIILFGLGGVIAHFSLTGIETHGTLCIAAGIRFLLIPTWLLCKSSQENAMLPTNVKRRLALTPVSTITTLIEKTTKC